VAAYLKSTARVTVIGRRAIALPDPSLGARDHPPVRAQIDRLAIGASEASAPVARPTPKRRASSSIPRRCDRLDVVRVWVPVSAGLAPVALIGSWSVAASRQANGYDSVRETISALAAQGATDRWIMTSGLAVLGMCHVVTAAGFTEIGQVSRAILGIGGIATVLVAALPQPNVGHVPAATVGFLALAVWPGASMLRFPGARGMAVILLCLLAWLALELRGGSLLGLSERVLAGSEALVPLAFAAVVAGRRWRPSAGLSLKQDS
jgi:hypothetical membrane protein